MTSIRAEGLTRRFGDLVAVDSLTFHVDPGEVGGLIGDNGLFFVHLKQDLETRPVDWNLKCTVSTTSSRVFTVLRLPSKSWITMVS